MCMLTVEPTRLRSAGIWSQILEAAAQRCSVKKVSTLLKKGLWHRYFPVNFVKFLRNLFLKNTSGQLLLKFPQKIFILTLSIIKPEGKQL